MKVIIRFVCLLIPVALAGCKKDDSSFGPSCQEHISHLLKENYERDVAGVAINYMLNSQDPRFYEVELPEAITDEIWQGLDAIYRTSTPQRDSVFSKYCVHHVVGNSAVGSCIVVLSDNSPIAEAWETGEIQTGIIAVDNLIDTYGFELNQYNNGTAVIKTDKLLNMEAFAIALKESHQSISSAQANLLNAGAGRIIYSKENGYRHFKFVFEWFDCYDTCDNYHQWEFKVDPQCKVTYLGVESGGINGHQPLPEPLNCAL